MTNDTKDKLVDGAIVAAKSTAMIVGSLALAGATGARGGIFPRPINMWKNRRRERSINEWLAANGVTADGNVKVTWKDGTSKVMSLQWAAFNHAGRSKTELAYDTARFNGAVSFDNGRMVIEREGAE
jgi:hypothetical protein